MVTFDNEQIYIETATSLEDKIAKIDNIIDALFVTAAKAAANSNIQEYSLNDGQTTIRTVYRDANAVMASIQVYERMKAHYINKLNGRTVRLIDSQNFN